MEPPHASFSQTFKNLLFVGWVLNPRASLLHQAKEPLRRLRGEDDVQQDHNCEQQAGHQLVVEDPFQPASAGFPRTAPDEPLALGVCWCGHRSDVTIRTAEQTTNR